MEFILTMCSSKYFHGISVCKFIPFFSIASLTKAPQSLRESSKKTIRSTMPTLMISISQDTADLTKKSIFIAAPFNQHPPFIPLCI